IMCHTSTPQLIPYTTLFRSSLLAYFLLVSVLQYTLAPPIAVRSTGTPHAVPVTAYWPATRSKTCSTSYSHSVTSSPCSSVSVPNWRLFWSNTVGGHDSSWNSMCISPSYISSPLAVTADELR